MTSLADPSANIIFGAVVDDRYTGEIHVTIIATGFPQSFQKSLLADPKGARLSEIQDAKLSGVQPVGVPSGPSTQPAPSRLPRRLFF